MLSPKTKPTVREHWLPRFRARDDRKLKRPGSARTGARDPRVSLLLGILGLLLELLVDDSQGGEEVAGKEDKERKAAHQHLSEERSP